MEAEGKSESQLHRKHRLLNVFICNIFNSNLNCWGKSKQWAKTKKFTKKVSSRLEETNRVWGQFHETKLSINSPEVEQNLPLERKTRENFSFKVSRNFHWVEFTLNFCLMKLTPGCSILILIKSCFTAFSNTHFVALLNYLSLPILIVKCY